MTRFLLALRVFISKLRGTAAHYLDLNPGTGHNPGIPASILIGSV
jgi:hypothetical protein